MGPKGPDKWGSLDPKFAVCADGKAQSPIDISRTKATPNNQLRALSRDYYSAGAKLVNNGFNIAVSGRCGLKLMPLEKFQYCSAFSHSSSQVFVCVYLLAGTL